MNFKKWLDLNEGFGVDYDNLPDTFHPGNYDSQMIQKKDKSLIDSIYQSKAITFAPLARPQDFIKIEKINKIQQISIGDKALLPSFEGVNILYGMKFSTPKKAAGEQISLEFGKRIKILTDELEKLEKQRKTVRNSTDISLKMKEIIIQTYQDAMIKANGYFDIVKKIMPSFLSTKFAENGLDEKPWTWAKIEKTYQSINNKSVGVGRAGIEKKINSIKQELDQVTQQNESKNSFRNIVQQAFLKKIKFPQSPEDESLANNFVQLAVDNYLSIKANYPYEYIIYPESRSNLNAKIANSFAQKYNAQAVQGFSKLETPNIDTTNFYRANQDKPDDWKKDAIGRLQGQIDSSKGQIKNIQMNRSYVKNWQMAPNLNQNLLPAHEISGLTNRRILVIDDNVDSSGTLQAINKVLRTQKPKSIHIYTPLWANFTY